MDGILNIDKPAGETSYDVVAAVKRLSGEKRVGHAGTLDPMATGVLPVCLGRGTRVIEFLRETAKAYRAQVELGVATDTYDASGEITGRGDSLGIDREQVAVALTSFRGSIEQIPPMYSAVKHHGKRLYQLARAGIEVERKNRPAEIYCLEIVDWHPPLVTLEIECGSGTYIRSIAHDLGQALGCGAHLKSLVRLRYGIFDIGEAISMSQFEESCRGGYWRQLVYPIDIMLSHWAAMVVSDDMGLVLKNGRPLVLPNDESAALTACEERCRVYTPDGLFAGVLHFNTEKGEWRPGKIFL